MAALRVRRRADFLLATVDTAVALVTAETSYLLRFEGETLPRAYSVRYLVASLALVPVWVAVARVAGLYRRTALRLGSDLLPAAFRASLLTGVLLYLLDLVGLAGRLSRAWVLLDVLGLLLLGVGSRGVLRRGRRALVPLGIALERYAILGTDVEAQRLRGDLTRAPGAPYVIAALLDEAEPAVVASRAREQRLDGVITPPGLPPERAAALANALDDVGVELLAAPAFGDVELRVTGLASFHGVSLLRLAGLRARRRAVRRPVSARSAAARRERGVAILGTRGIPASYGGFETFAERLATHLVGRGVPVTVYCRTAYATAGQEWNGVRLVTLPTIRNKYLDTVVHTSLSALHLLARRGPTDVILCNAANAPVLALLRTGRRRTLMNVDGLEWRRGKWGVAGRSWYRMGEWLAVRLASVLVTDADEVRTYYRVRHDADSIMIPYGADLLERGLPLPAEVSVEPDRYVLYVSRWERENNPVMVAAAHAASGVALPLVMLGKATYDDALEAEVRGAAGPLAQLPGPLYGEGYRGLQASALAYVHATEVGGTHPALIEAMGAGNLCLVYDTPENREVAGAVAWMFGSPAELADCLRRVEALDATALAEVRARTRAYAAARYSWEAVGDAYLGLLRGKPSPVAETMTSAQSDD